MLLFVPAFAPAKRETLWRRERYSEKLPLVSGLMGEAGQLPHASCLKIDVWIERGGLTRWLERVKGV